VNTELFLTLVRDGVTVDLVVPLTEGTGADIYRAAAKRYGDSAVSILTIERSGAEIRRDAALSDVGVLSGDRIVVGWQQTIRPTQLAEAHLLTLVEGPEAGRIIELVHGTIELGRGSSGALRVGLDDPTVSRQHAEFEVDGDSVRLRDLGSSNGTELNGTVLTNRHGLETGDLVRFGDSVAKVELTGLSGERHHLTQGRGRISFNREPRVLTPDPAAEHTVPSPPATPQPRRFPLPGAILPVVMGTTMFFVLGSPYFLLMAGMGPLMVIWTTLDDRRSGRREFKTDSETYVVDLASLEEDLAATANERRVWLETRYPTSSTLIARARTHDRSIWRRRPRDEDFISVRIGTGALPAVTPIQLPPAGDEDLLGLAATLAEQFATERELPIHVSLYEHPVVGIVQEDEAVGDLLRSVVAQLVTDQSPRELALAVLAPQHGEDWNFAKWLPHVQSLGTEVRLIADGEDQARALFGSLTGVVDRRLEAADESIGSGQGRFSPHIVVMIHPPAKLSRREVTEFLERAPRAGVSMIWVAADRGSLPGECTAVIDIASTSPHVTFTDTGVVRKPDSLELVDRSTIEAVSRALAPLDDVSAGSDSLVPTRIDLLDLLGLPDINSADIQTSWNTHRKGLGAVIGADGNGPVEVEWRRDGPHALVAGTTGAGKSELLQSLVASMAIMHPPSSLTFVLIDYKGGAAFKDCEPLPHTVGMVTDLDDHLAGRALISLGAELHHRERLLADAGAKDIIEMVEKSPRTAPPNLLIIIDEFAALKSEVPEFVDGIVDIAQRGRSLGVHLLLATQQPSGVIDPKIQGNTNLRIALRVADSADSVDVIGRSDAHQISKSLPGRGYVRTGPTDISEFQSAYVGGSDISDEDPGAVTFYFGMKDRAKLAESLDGRSSGTSDLQRIVAAATEAASLESIDAPRLPWVDALSHEILYSSLVDSDVGMSFGTVFGLADHPDEQTQRPHTIDFDQYANVLVLGSSGAGKTTFLRTVAMDLILRNSADHLWIYALDFGSRGLSALESLPHCGGVVFSDDLDRTRRLLEILTRTVAERTQELASVNAAGPTEYEEVTGVRIPRIVVFIDGFGQLWDALDGIDRSEHLSTLGALFADGRAVGLHFVVSADRRQAVPSSITASISGRYMLRMAERDEYVSFGIPALARSAPPVDGRAFDASGLEIQVGVLSYGDSTAAAAQSQALVEVSNHLETPSTPVPRPDLLPEDVELSELSAPGGLLVPVGLEETNLSTAMVNFDDGRTFIVFGPDRSGRSTALAILAQGLGNTVEAAYLLAGRRTPLADMNLWKRTATGVEAAAPVAALLQEQFEARLAAPESHRPILIVIEDGDDFGDGPVGDALGLVVKRARDANFIVIASMTVFAGHKSYATWVRAMRTNRQGLLLQPDLQDDGDLFGIRLPQRSGLVMPAGRGFLIERGSTKLIQTASHL